MQGININLRPKSAAAKAATVATVPKPLQSVQFHVTHILWESLMAVPPCSSLLQGASAK